MNYYQINNEHGNAWIMTGESRCVVVQQPHNHPPSIVEYEKPYSKQNGDVVVQSDFATFHSKAFEVFKQLTARAKK